MLIENLLFEIWFKKDSLKYLNNYIIDEIEEGWPNDSPKETHNKIIGLVHANLSVIESLEKILNSYQDIVDTKYAEFLKTEM